MKDEAFFKSEKSDAIRIKREFYKKIILGIIFTGIVKFYYNKI